MAAFTTLRWANDAFSAGVFEDVLLLICLTDNLTPSPPAGSDDRLWETGYLSDLGAWEVR